MAARQTRPKWKEGRRHNPQQTNSRYPSLAPKYCPSLRPFPRIIRSYVRITRRVPSGSSLGWRVLFRIGKFGAVVACRWVASFVFFVAGLGWAGLGKSAGVGVGVGVGLGKKEPGRMIQRFVCFFGCASCFLEIARKVERCSDRALGGCVWVLFH